MPGCGGGHSRSVGCFFTSLNFLLGGKLGEDRPNSMGATFFIFVFNFVSGVLLQLVHIVSIGGVQPAWASSMG